MQSHNGDFLELCCCTYSETEDDALQVARVALAYSHFETASNSVLLTCSRILKKNQESRAPLQFPHNDEALVAHLLSTEEPAAADEVF